jgi:hypothetical protein
VRPGILPRLTFDLLGIGVFEKSGELRAELREMIKQLCICKIVRSRNVRMLIDCGDPRLKNLLPVGEYKISKASDCWGRGRCLIVTSDGRNPPNLISEVNTFAALG